jgi:hypothetical protein
MTKRLQPARRTRSSATTWFGIQHVQETTPAARG